MIERNWQDTTKHARNKFVFVIFSAVKFFFKLLSREHFMKFMLSENFPFFYSLHILWKVCVCVTCISVLWNQTPEAINMLAMKQHTTEAGQHWNEWQAQMVYSQIPAQKRKYLGLIFHHLFQNISLSANLFLHTKSLKSVAGGTDFQQTNQHHTCFKKYLCNYCHVNHKHNVECCDCNAF